MVCDECRIRTMCMKHVPEFAAIPRDILEGLHFRCPSCHVQLTRNDHESAPYYVSGDVVWIALHID